MSFNTPILLVIFNRPDTTEKVFQAIRQQRPTKLFVAADGPRAGNAHDAIRCKQARDIATAIDWNCELHTLLRSQNLGCGRGPFEAISWFFSQVNEGIILEDDCVPSPSFFPFCEELLERYRDDWRVMQIGGVNMTPHAMRDREYSYSFSNHNYIWGWATWKSRWDLLDFRMTDYPVAREKNYLKDYFETFGENDYFDKVFRRTFERIEKTDVWDYQWQFCRMLNSGLCVCPSSNLVVNLGWGDAATHTKSHHESVLNLKHEPLAFPLVHPEFVMVNRQSDSVVFNTIFTTPWARFKARVKRMLVPGIQLYYYALIFAVNTGSLLSADLLPGERSLPLV